MSISVPCSIGELYDKYSILCIKLEKISDEIKREKVKREMEKILPIMEKFDLRTDEPLFMRLKAVNDSLWNIEDRIRIKEKEFNFDEEFIFLARKVYLTNDERYRIKNMINQEFESELSEVKSYCL